MIDDVLLFFYVVTAEEQSRRVVWLVVLVFSLTDFVRRRTIKRKVESEARGEEVLFFRSVPYLLLTNHNQKPRGRCHLSSSYHN